MIAGKVVDVLFLSRQQRIYQNRPEAKNRTEQSKIEPFFKFDTSNLH